MNFQEKQDLEEIYERVKGAWRLQGARILVTGAGGFLGYYYSRFLIKFFEKLELDYLALADLRDLSQSSRHGSHNKRVEFFACDLSDFASLPFDPQSFDVVINLASFASPVAYRAQPKATMRGSVLTVWEFLDSYVGKKSDFGAFQIFSSSEIYGDPTPENIPTNEDYRGNVSCLGPRACYDESKRFIETLGSVYAIEDHVNVSIVRPFNNFGPGMSLNDGRLPADVMKAIFGSGKLEIYSDGKPTRSFCYVVDAIVGYILALNQAGLSVFNIGNDTEEISVHDFVNRSASVMLTKMGKPLDFNFVQNEDRHYLTDNPNRRFPDLLRARQQLNFHPSIGLEEGIGRWIEFERQKSMAE